MTLFHISFLFFQNTQTWLALSRRLEMGIKSPPFCTWAQWFSCIGRLCPAAWVPCHIVSLCLQKASVRFFNKHCQKWLGFYENFFPLIFHRVISVGHNFESKLNGQSHEISTASLGPTFHLYIWRIELLGLKIGLTVNIFGAHKLNCLTLLKLYEKYYSITLV